MDKRVEILELEPEVHQLIGECELTGKRTVFQRNGRSVVVLVSYDEYLALRETIAITNDPELRARIEQAEDEVKRGALMLAEDLE